jgi:hypothetical protein
MGVVPSAPFVVSNSPDKSVNSQIRQFVNGWRITLPLWLSVALTVVIALTVIGVLGVVIDRSVGD